MLLIGIIKELEKSPLDFGLLSYFFCQANEPKLNNATAVLRGLIYQLLAQQQSLISHVRKKYDEVGLKLFEGNNAFFALSNIFIDMLQDPSLKRMYLIVDALDECESELPQLLDLIVRSASDSSPRVKWLVSSRPRLDIEQRLRLEKDRIELDLEKNVQDHVSYAVNAYINHKVSELAQLAQLKQYDGKLQDDVRSYLRMNADGTFLWVALVCKQLADPKTQRRKTLSVLKSFAPGLQPFYQRMMDQMHALNDDEDLESCKRILASITLAYRPIHLEELVSITCLSEEFSDDRGSLEELVGLCGSFLIIRKCIIDFVHRSAQDYLGTHAAPKDLPPWTCRSTSPNRITVIAGHEYTAKGYLRLAGSGSSNRSSQRPRSEPPHSNPICLSLLDRPFMRD
jgi:hypothetical protein